jgi:hypothetical protein
VVGGRACDYAASDARPTADATTIEPIRLAFMEDSSPFNP